MLFNQLPVHIFEATSRFEDEDDDEDDYERLSPAPNGVPDTARASIDRLSALR
jgi:hypothetical protein